MNEMMPPGQPPQQTPTAQPPQAGPPPGPPQSPEQQEPGGGESDTAEVERGIASVGKALYQDEGMSEKILAMVSDEEKVGSTAKAAIMLVTEMDKKIDLDEDAIAPVTVFAADRLMELVEADGRNGIEYSEMEAKQVIMTTMEGILTAYGSTPEDQAELAAQVGPEETQQYQKTYEETLNG